MPADWLVIALVLLAALLHATWNAVGKASADPLGGIALITATGGIAIACLIPFVPAPARAAWPYLAASVALHFCYQLSLVAAYRHGDLSQVYPIARGLAPLGIALVAALTIGEAPATHQGVGLLLASAAIASFAFGGNGSASRHAVMHAGLTAVWISVYSVVDGQGTRVSGHALSFACWTLALDSIPIKWPTPTPEQAQGLCLDRGYDYAGVRELVSERGFTAHIRTRGEEIARKLRTPGFRARRWVVVAVDGARCFRPPKAARASRDRGPRSGRRGSSPTVVKAS